MCATCGCGEDEVRLTTVGPGHEPHGHPHAHHPHDHDHTHPHAHDRTHTLDLEVAVLAKNDERAAGNRRWLADHDVTALNVMSSPGAGKTTLLERTIAEIDR